MGISIYEIGSGLSSLIGSFGLNYFKKTKSDNIIVENINNKSIKYNMVDESLKETIVSSSEQIYLGVTFNDKCNKLIQICKDECGININNKGTQNRKKLLRYINEYNRIGYDAFINNHKKKNFIN
tara:strand:+ start:94 stop:468 length:375 start_codon:yes stop_codon:yes gene_type:complete